MSTKTKGNVAENFVGSVFKFSISTFAAIGIQALAILLTGFFLTKEVNGEIGPFISWTNTIMTIAILGLDQALIRFYYEPPAGLSTGGLFRVCFYFSSLALLVGGAVCSTLLISPIYSGLGFETFGPIVVPLLFLNAFFFMVLRYFNVLYRMEKNIPVYTTVVVLMQFFYRLFFLLGRFISPAQPLWPMVICSLLGLGSFALAFSFFRRKDLAPRKGEFSREAYKTVLPYGLFTAPSAVFVTLNGAIPFSYILNTLGSAQNGIYSFAYTLSNVVTLIQGGFAAFWGAYMFENYKTEQARIKRVHDYLNFIILVFFACLVAFMDVAFWIFREYAAAQSIFPLMMLSAVFTILCETTVYGNAIARKPHFDSIGLGLSFATNIAGCVLLVPRFGILGAAIAIVLANVVMFLFRTYTAQKLYPSIPSVSKTVAAVLLAVALACLGTLLAYRFLAKLIVSLIAIAIYCLLYRNELGRLWQLGLGILRGLFKGEKA